MQVGDTGVTYRVNTSFDMSSNTELEIVFIRPGTTTKVIKASADGVTLGTSTITQEVDGSDVTFTANEYLEYEIEVGLLTVKGTWKAYGRYTNTAPTPDDYFSGKTATFQVDEPGEITC